MVQAHPFKAGISHTDSGVVTIAFGAETAALVLGCQDAIEFACDVLKHCGVSHLRLDFTDGRDSLDCNHGKHDGSDGSSP